MRQDEDCGEDGAPGPGADCSERRGRESGAGEGAGSVGRGCGTGWKDSALPVSYRVGRRPGWCPAGRRTPHSPG